MKRTIAALSMAAAGLAVAAPAAQASTNSNYCIYQVTVDTKIYENTQWDTNGGHWQNILKGTYVLGPCGSSGGWTPISKVWHNNKWVPVAQFIGDRDFMRTWTLDWMSTNS